MNQACFEFNLFNCDCHIEKCKGCKNICEYCYWFDKNKEKHKTFFSDRFVYWMNISSWHFCCQECELKLKNTISNMNQVVLELKRNK